MNYRSDIDGLRAVAVLPVLFYHAGLVGFSGGFVGVDVFFVISGYLITQIIFGELQEGRFSILSFYERRARRILPALFVVLVVSLAAGWVLLFPDDYDQMARSAVSALLFTSNIWFWQNSGGYFGGATDYLPLLHTWSLAVEEQFYIVFPLFLMALMRFGRRATFVLTLALVLASLALAIWATLRMPSASFYILPTRIWELGVGSLLALSSGLFLVPRWLRETLAAVGLLAILLTVTLYTSATAFPGIGALPPVLGAAALIWAGSSGSTLTGQLLSWRPLVFVGLMSYSLYLWHWPIMAFARNRLFSVELPLSWQIATILLAFVAAFASLHLVEHPFRAKRDRAIGQGGIFVLSGLGAMTIAGLAIAIVVSGGAEQRFTPEKLEADATITKPIERDWQCTGVPEVCFFGDTHSVTLPTWALWGDSHAGALLPAVGVVAARENRSLVMFAKGGCPPLPGLWRAEIARSENVACERLNRTALDTISANSNVKTVFLAARWPLYVEGTSLSSEGGERVVLIEAGSRNSNIANDPSGNSEVFETALSDLLSQLRDAGKNVVLIGSVPEIPWDVTTRLRALVLFDIPLPESRPNIKVISQRQARTDAILQAQSLRDGVIYSPIAKHLCRLDCPTHDGLMAFYSDNHHLLPDASRRLIAPILADAIAE